MLAPGLLVYKDGLYRLFASVEPLTNKVSYYTCKTYGIHMGHDRYYHGSLTVDHAYVRAGAGNIVSDYNEAKNIGINCLYDRDADTRMTVQNGSYVSAYALLNNNGNSNDLKAAIRPVEGLYISNSKGEAASQSGYAIALNSVRNNAPGKAWTNFAGTEGETAIPVSNLDGSGQTMPLCKKNIIGQKNTVTVNNGLCSGTGSFEVQEEVTVTANYRELDRAVVTQIPTAKTGLVANDSALELINAGSASGGTLKYALGNANEVTGAWDTLVPKGTNAGTYYVWYKAVGKDTHRDSIPAYVTVSIAEKSSSGGNGGGNSNNGGSNEGGNSEESSENGGSSTNNEAIDNNSTEESKNNSGSDNNSSNEIKDEREVKFGDDPFYRALDSDRKFLVPIDYVDRSGSPWR